MGDIFVGDVGVEIRLDTKQDLSNATVTKILAKKPSGSTVVWNATKYGTTTKITYTTDSDDLDEAGDWSLQAYVEWTTSSKHLGETVTMTVTDPWK